MPEPSSITRPNTPSAFSRSLTLFDCSMIVVGVMIGSGIFIVPASMARAIQSPGWFLVAWLFTGVLTIAAAICYGELSSMLPKAGGMYQYLSEAYSPFWGFLYGWTFFTVIQTGTIAAVAVAFARFTGVLFPRISESKYIISPLHFSSHYAISLSSAQLLALAVIALLTGMNTVGIKYGKWVQNIFTLTKLGSLAALIFVGLVFGYSSAAVHENFRQIWQLRPVGMLPSAVMGHPIITSLIAVCLAQTGSLFAADSWHNVTFASEEVRVPKRTLPLSLIIGSTLVICLYFATNLVYLANLPFSQIQNAHHDLVATAMMEHVFSSRGEGIMAVIVMISTFGCVNSLILSGARAHYAIAMDGLFPRVAGELNSAGVPGWSLYLQALWAALLVTLNTYSPQSGYGNLYNNLLDYIISAALLFYILTIAAVMVLRRKRPQLERPYRAFGYPATPLLYIAGAGTIVICLYRYRPETTWPGLLIVACGAPVYWLIRMKRTH